MSDFEESASGIFSAERAARILEQRSDCAPRLEWTPELVRFRLSQAARAIEQLAGRVGPKQRITFWPDPDLVVGLSDEDKEARAEGIAHKTRLPERSRMFFTQAEVAEIEDACAWPGRYLAKHDRERKAVQVFFWCEAKGEAFGRFCNVVAPRRTAYRLLDRGLETIMRGLIKEGIRP